MARDSRTARINSTIEQALHQSPSGSWEFDNDVVAEIMPDLYAYVRESSWIHVQPTGRIDDVEDVIQLVLVEVFKEFRRTGLTSGVPPAELLRRRVNASLTNRYNREWTLRLSRESFGTAFDIAMSQPLQATSYVPVEKKPACPRSMRKRERESVCPGKDCNKVLITRVCRNCGYVAPHEHAVIPHPSVSLGSPAPLIDEQERVEAKVSISGIRSRLKWQDRYMLDLWLRCNGSPTRMAAELDVGCDTVRAHMDAIYARARGEDNDLRLAGRVVANVGLVSRNTYRIVLPAGATEWIQEGAIVVVPGRAYQVQLEHVDPDRLIAYLGGPRPNTEVPAVHTLKDGRKNGLPNLLAWWASPPRIAIEGPRKPGDPFTARPVDRASTSL